MRSSLKKYNRAITWDIIISNWNLEMSEIIVASQFKKKDMLRAVFLFCYYSPVQDYRRRGFDPKREKPNARIKFNQLSKPKEIIHKVSQGYTFILAPLLFYHFLQQKQKGTLNRKNVFVNSELKWN